MKEKLIIGIDPSINSTGICVRNPKTGESKYYIITSKMTKKMKSFDNQYVKFLPYDKQDAKESDYSKKENLKFLNIFNICNRLISIIDSLSDFELEAYMEGVSYGSVGSAALVDLSFLNASLRMTLINNSVPFTIVSPTSLKKFACANGQADKFLMIDAWKRMDKNISDIKDIKIDDLADSYFLSCYKHDN